jgi:hypothetical protein
MDEVLNNENVINTDTNEMYLEEIKNLKKNTVSLSDYERLKDENRNLLKTIVEQGQVEATAEPTPTTYTKEELGKMCKDLLSFEGNNLEYVEKSLKLREAMIQSGERDPYIPYGSHYAPTDEDIATANKTAQVYQECVDYAQGDNEVFTNELMRRTVDIPIPKRR